MIERIEHVINIIDYPSSDFLFPGPSDLTADLKKIKRGEYREFGDNKEIIDLVKRLTRLKYKGTKPELLAIKILVDQIPSRNGQVVHNVYMPNQLVSLKTI